MHVRSFLLLIFLLSGMALKAQFYVTPQIGYTFSSIMQDKQERKLWVYSPAHDMIKPSIGIIAGMQVFKNVKLQTDFFYSQKGSQIAISRRIDGTISTSNDYEFLEVNSKHLDLGVQLAYAGIDKLTFESGLYYSHLLEKNISIQSRGTQVTDNDITPSYDSEIGASLGMSYTLLNITARAKYSIGIWGTEEDEKNHWFLLALGYRFEI